MILRAPAGTIDEVMLWLKGLQSSGCMTVAEAADVAEVVEGDEAALGRPEGGGALIDPRKVNVFLGEIQEGKTEDCKAEEAEEGRLGV